MQMPYNSFKTAVVNNNQLIWLIEIQIRFHFGNLLKRQVIALEIESYHQPSL